MRSRPTPNVEDFGDAYNRDIHLAEETLVETGTDQSSGA
jgi:hypothetical protein